MSPSPPLPGDQRKVDANHLDLLSIFHFVGAGLALLGILFLFAHFALMHTVLDPKMWSQQKHPAPPPELINALKWLYLVFGLWFTTSCVLNLISGFCLRARKHRTFSLVVSAINCLHIPLGTTLGIFTIVVLSRESVRESYGERTRL